VSSRLGPDAARKHWSKSSARNIWTDAITSCCGAGGKWIARQLYCRTRNKSEVLLPFWRVNDRPCFKASGIRTKANLFRILDFYSAQSSNSSVINFSDKVFCTEEVQIFLFLSVGESENERPEFDSDCSLLHSVKSASDPHPAFSLPGSFLRGQMAES
jgi:hypothetical protein